MTCPKCGSENVDVQVVSETSLKRKSRGIFYWLFFVWLIDLMLWVFLTIPRLLIAMFAPKRQKTVTKHKSMFVCKQCGSHWAA